MSQIKLKDEIKGKKTVSFIKKPALWGSKCDYCGLIFTMEKYCNDRLDPAILNGTFSLSASDKNGKSLGNIFQATVCSFECAHKIFDGAWKNMPEYRPYKKANAYLIRVELGLTSLIKIEEDLIAEWKKLTIKRN